MPGPRARVQVALHRDLGLPEDDIVNTMHFEGDDDLSDYNEQFDTLTPGLVDRVKTFYQAIAPIFLSNLISNTVTLKVYDMEEAEPRYPKHTEDFTVTPMSGISFPAEVAICVSFAAAQVSGQPMGRKRGRIYLGPINAAIGESLSPNVNDVAIHPTTRATALGHFVTMATGTSGAFRLAVWSPTQDAETPGADACWNDVVTTWIDNRFDTIRKRGGRSTDRVTLPV